MLPPSAATSSTHPLRLARCHRRPGLHHRRRFRRAFPEHPPPQIPQLRPRPANRFPSASGRSGFRCRPSASVRQTPPASARPHRHRLPPRNPSHHALPPARRTPLRSRRIRHESRNRPGSLRPPCLARPRPAACPVTLLLVPDEEIGSPASRPLTERLALRSSAVLVLEPAAGAAGACKTSRKGVARYTLRVDGRAAHAGPTSSAAPRPSSRPPTRASLSAGCSVPPRDSPSTLDSSPEAFAPMWSPISPKLSLMCASSPHPRPLAPMPEFIACARAIPAAASKFSAASSGLPSSVARHRRPLSHGGPGRNPARLPTGRGCCRWRIGRQSHCCPRRPTLDGLGAVGDGAHAPHEFVEIRELPRRSALLAELITMLAAR